MSLYPTPSNMTGVHGLFSHADTVVSGQLMPLFILVIFVAAFLILAVNKKIKTSDALALTSLVTFLLGSLLWGGGLLDQRYIVILLILAVSSVIWCIFDNK